MDKQFDVFLHNFVKQYKTDVFNNVSKCKSLLLDHAKGEFKKEIRLLLQALGLGCHTVILNSNDLNLTRMTLIRQFQDEYFISEEISTSLIDLLLLEIKNYKPKPEKSVKQAESPLNSIIHSQSVTNNNTSNLSNDILNKLNLMISQKENSNKMDNQKLLNQKLFVENFKEKVKSVYEPVFDEYQKVMNEKKLNCRYYSERNSIVFEFSFYNRVYQNKPLSYRIFHFNQEEINLVGTSAYYAIGLNDFTRQYAIENFTRENIINDLLRLTKICLG